MHFKPSRWNVSPALVMPEAQSLWKGVAFVAPLWRGVGKGVLLNSLGYPLAGANLTAGSTLQWRGTPYGMGVGISGASNLLSQNNYQPITTSDGVGTGDFTLVCLADPKAEARASVVLGQSRGFSPYNWGLFLLNSDWTGGAVSGQLSFSTYDGSVSNVAANVAGAIDGKMRLFGGVRAGNQLRAYVDGVLRATVTGTIQNTYNAASGFAIGNNPQTTTFRIATDTEVVFAAGWNRALSAAEIRLLARDPFCMFRPQAEWGRMWRPPGGGSAVLNPVDIANLAGLEIAGFSQVHMVSPSEANLAESFEGAGFSQAHLFAAQEMNLALAFDSAALAPGSMGAPEFRSAKISGNLRNRNIASDGASVPVAQDARFRTITE